jgi:hypothetical protein
MIKIDTISKEELDKFEEVEPNVFQIPNDLMVYTESTNQDRKNKILQELEQIGEIVEPTTDELIDFAKDRHPYYELKSTKDELEIELNKL